jgi:hypothetical protein
VLWPADEPWPVCDEGHRQRGRRPGDVRREREVLAAAFAREAYAGLTETERALVDELRREHRVPEGAGPVPMVGLAQLYRRDLPDLPDGPDGCDLLQVFWCPFDAHGEGRHEPLLHLRWRRSAEVGKVLASPPQPQVVGYEGYLPEPCRLHPEQVVTYPFAGLLPEELCERIDAWDEAQEDEADEDGPEAIGYQYDLSIPSGWRVGGFASWHRTDPAPMDCLNCRTPMELLLTVASSEWDGTTSWRPVEDDGLHPHPHASPTRIRVGRDGDLNVFACPADPAHPHRWSLQ